MTSIPIPGTPNSPTNLSFGLPRKREKKIRIAVAVCSEGHWSPGVNHDHAFGELSGLCWEEDCAPDEAIVVHFVTATIPLPQSAEVPGEVEP